MNDFFREVYFRNTVLEYFISVGVILLGLLLTWIFRRILLNKANKWVQKTNTGIDNYLIRGLERFGIPALYFAAIYFGLNYLEFSRRAQAFIDKGTTVIITILVLRLVSSTILLLLQTHFRKQEKGEEKLKQVGGLMIVVNIIIWIVGLVFLFDNMGYNVTAIVTGLGIGGIAVALAAQNILGDLFNYFVIFFDRPFETGDFISVDDKSGTVDYIGIKTTRLISLSGEQLIFSNSNLTSSRIHNFKRMQRRRIAFSINVAYDTPPEVLKEIPTILKSIVNGQQQVLLDRAHFASYGSYSFIFEVVYFVLTADYNTYMDIQQNINLQILEELKHRDVQLADSRTTMMVGAGEESFETK